MLAKSQRCQRLQVYDKKYACPFCRKLVSKFAEHILTHPSEPSVIRLTTVTKLGSSARRSEIADLRKRGAFLHNLEVMRNGYGRFLVQRQSTVKTLTPQDFRACPKCLGYYRRSVITAHFNKCAPTKTMSTIKEFNFSLRSADLDEKLTPVTRLMKDDAVTHVAIKDGLICEFGKKLYSRLLTKGTVTKTETYVSTKMRELARLLLQVRSTKDRFDMTLDDLIYAENFQCVVDCTISLCKLDHADLKRTIPSLAEKIGYSLKKSANDALVRAIEQHDTRREAEVEKFLKLLQLEWEQRVASAARSKLRQKNTLRIDPMPLAEDLQVGFTFGRTVLTVQFCHVLKTFNLRNSMAQRGTC